MTVHERIAIGAPPPLASNDFAHEIELTASAGIAALAGALTGDCTPSEAVMLAGRLLQKIAVDARGLQ